MLGTVVTQPWAVTVEAAEGVDALVLNKGEFSSAFTEQLYPSLLKFFRDASALKQVPPYRILRTPLKVLLKFNIGFEVPVKTVGGVPIETHSSDSQQTNHLYMHSWG